MTVFSVIAAVSIGLGALLLFLTPRQIGEAFALTRPREMGLSMLFFFVGCWLMVERWRSCLSYRADRGKAFHTMGVCNAGNLLIPGRAGEPLRVYLLARLGVGAEYGTSALVQERLADWMLRVVFIGFAILLSNTGSGEELASRLVGSLLISLAVILVLVGLVRRRETVARLLGKSLGKLPRLQPDSVESFLQRMLKDLSEVWTHPGGRMAVLWGFLAWLVFSFHTKYVLDCFIDHDTLAMSFLLLALTPATAPTQPGFFHGFAVAAMLIFGAEKVPALQAAVVAHMIQMVVFSLWGIASWFAIDRMLALDSEDSDED